MKRFLLYIILLFSTISAEAQSPTPIGAKNATLEVLGNMMVDSSFSLPWIDTSTVNTKAGQRAIGQIGISKTDSLPKFRKDGYFVSVFTSYDTNYSVSSHAYIEDRINQLLNDSSLHVSQVGYGLKKQDSTIYVDSVQVATQEDIAMINATLSTKGTVNRVSAGYGLTGGNITDTGTLKVDTTGIAAKPWVLSQISGSTTGITDSVYASDSTLRQQRRTSSIGLKINTGYNIFWTNDSSTFKNDIVVDSVNIGSGNQSKYNVRFGYHALAAVTSGSGDVAIGRESLKNCTTCTGVVSVGDRAHGNTGTGISGSIAIGQLAQQNATGNNNVSIGFQSFSNASFSGTGDVGVGTFAGLAQTSGNNNTYIGHSAGSVVVSGANKVILGSFNGSGFTTTSGDVFISNGAGTVYSRWGTTGNMLVGTTTDNGTDKLQVNGSVSISSAPTGAIGDPLLVYNTAGTEVRQFASYNTITATGNTTFSVPTKALLMTVTIVPASNETIQIGTTNGGTDILAPTAFTGSAITTVTINKVFSRSTTQTIYINGASGSVTYDIRVF